MDDGTWQSKCSSTWKTPATAVAPGPAAAEDQMVMNSQGIIRPSVQEQLVFRTLNIDSAKLGKPERSSNIRPFPSIHVAVSGLNSSVPVTNVRSLLELHDGASMRNMGNSSFVGTRPSSMSPIAEIPDFRRNLQMSNLHVQGSQVTKPCTNQYSVNGGGGASQYHTLNTRTPQTKPTEAMSISPAYGSAGFRGRPRVLCMNAVGVLFLTDTGLLGVLCLCHSLQMSLAKFCEHSGSSSSANPGEVVRLENGMTVALWRRLCFGNNAPDDDKEWGWPDSLMIKGGLVRSVGSHYPAPGITHVGGNASRPRIGQAAFKNWANNSIDNVQHKKGLEVYNHVSSSFHSSSQTQVPPALLKNRTMQSGKPSPNRLNEATQSVLSSGDKNVWSFVGNKGVSNNGKFGNSSIGFPYSGTKDGIGLKHNSNRGSFAAEADMKAGEGNSSHVDLSLGQPSQQTHSSVTSLLTTPDPLQSADYLKPTKKQRQSSQGFQLQKTSSNREEVPAIRTTLNYTEQKQRAGDATKNSLISLLFSHLSTKGSNSSQSTNKVDDYRPLDTGSLDVNDVSSNSNHAGSINGTHKRSEKKYLEYSFDLSNNMKNGKGLIGDNKNCSFVNENRIIHNNQTTENRIGKPVTSGHFPCSSYSVDAVRKSLQINRQSSILNNESDATNFDQCGKVRHENKDQHSHSLFGSINLQTGAVPMGTLNAIATESINRPLATFASSHRESADPSHHSLYENRQFSAQDRSSFTCKTSPRHEGWCSQKTVELQRMSCNSVLGSSEELRRQSCCNVQHDASRFAFQPIPSCSKCYCSGGAEALASEPGTRGNVCCNCSSASQWRPQCSTCHVCGAEEHPCLRLGKVSNSNNDSNKKKEQSPSIFRNCCCTGGSCFLTGDKSSGYPNEHGILGKSGIVHIASSCDDNIMIQDVNNIRSGQCNCFKKNNVVNNDFQNGRWRDVPTKLAGHSDGTLAEKSAEVLEAFSMTPLKESDETPQLSESTNQRQISTNYSVSSAPAATEISVEVNNNVSCATNIEDSKMISDPVVEDVSGAVKCGSSSEPLDDTSDCESLQSVTEKGKRSKTTNTNKPNISDPNSVCSPINSMSSQSKLTSSPKKCDALESDNKGPEIWNSPVKSSSFKRKRTAVFASGPLSLDRENHDNLSKSDSIKAASVDKSFTDSALKEDNARSLGKDIARQNCDHLDARKTPKFMSLSSIGNSSNNEIVTASLSARPVVAGRTGIIISSGRQKPAKIVSLSYILKVSKRCDTNENGVRCNELKQNHGSSKDISISNSAVSHENDKHMDGIPMNGSKTTGGSDIAEKPASDHEYHTRNTKPRYRGVRSCSLSEILKKNKFASENIHAPKRRESIGSDPSGEPKLSLSTLAEASLSKCSTSISLEKHAQKNQYHADQMDMQRCNKAQKDQSFLIKSDAACSVCGSPNKVNTNDLLECKGCFIRVHQACYGVPKVPNGHWFCRPCKTNSLNIVCVLCGYKGGAMTRAVKTQNIVQSLLKYWKFGTKFSILESDPSSETDRNENHNPSSDCETSTNKFRSVIATTSAICESFPKSAADIASSETGAIGYSECVPKSVEVHNSITAGAVDPSVIQWLHMVCGLWTPETRCPNVDTMSVFDVSGVSTSNKVCSMCNRPGGSCIKCRVLNCSVRFHPWCAHRKGLLQSETEGDDNEKVGFYGRCMLHATQSDSLRDDGLVVSEVANKRKEWTCARTEGFKGRKSEGSINKKPSIDSGGCIVSQEQINAWAHINGHRSCIRPVAASPFSDVGSDYRKEYVRYKQLKAWKHLVVYKSGIHALGLYTSQFISQGAMVVEYVGEIVSGRVADKRELEYQSSRRLQYKSACYFFRIDKEHIIDATCKGGIARFVNHSCSPNCVAKIITIKNEKKVVFFAERDINPGEEITYDYHFKREDEGQKIPCLCNSKNCRQYLN